MYSSRFRIKAPTARLRRRGITPHLSLLLVSIGLAGASAGCTHVAPYEREYLARPSMDTADREQAEETFRTHVAEAREGSGGGGTTAGGGCGCN